MRVIKNKTDAIYTYYEKRNKICTGTLTELSEKLNKRENYLRRLVFCPTRFRYLKLEGHITPIFEVFTPDGKAVFTGTKEECADFAGIADNTVLVGVHETLNGKRTGKNSYLYRSAGRKFIKVED